MSTILRAVRLSWRQSFARAAGGAGIAAAGCVACECSFDETECEGNLKRFFTEGMRKRDLVRCRGGDDELRSSYELQATIGKGGFGSVRKAIHRGTGLLRAIKSVSTTNTLNCEDDERDLAAEWDRMLSEVEALMDLDHPNIVRLYEYYRTPERLYLVEEYCSGGTLEQRLEAEGGRFDAATAAVNLRQMLRGLLCCHAHGLAHRDLKPDNFCYGSAHESASLKMIDFGLSIGRAGSRELSDGTKAPLAYVEAAGTLEYTAPETLPKRDADGKLTRTARYDQAADVWSVGAILFLMLTGEPLVDFETLRTSSAEFRRMLKSVATGNERDLLDDAATRIRSHQFIDQRLAFARRRAPPVACELLESMLRQDPEARITAKQALRHRFILDSYAANPRGHGVFDGEIIPKMRRFADAPAMRRLAVLVEAHLLGPQDDDAINTSLLTFRDVDADGMGVLTPNDLKAALKTQGLQVPDDLDEIFSCLDIDGDGGVSVIEFVASTMEPRLFCEPRLCRAAFRVLDADSDGYITTSDLEVMLMDGPKRAEHAHAILASAQPDEQGRVDFKQFCNVMLPQDVDQRIAIRVAEYMSKSFV